MAADLPWRCICIHGQRCLEYFFSDAQVGTGFSFSRMLQGSKTGDTKNINHTYDFLRKGCPNHLLIKYQQVLNLGIVKEAHICKITSKAEDHSSNHMQLRVDDMACQLEPGGYVISYACVN